MENKELRIGNKLQKKDGSIFTIKRIDETDDVLVIEENGLLTLNYNLIGINITNQWLEKLGFEYNDFLGGYQLNDIQYLYNDSFYFKQSELDIDLKFVHELQNLYYSLTKQELTISN